VAAVRRAAYGRPHTESPFQDDGMFKPDEGRPLPPVNEEAQSDYRRRFIEFFPERGLQGKRVVFFQHSAVGRDLLVELFAQLPPRFSKAGLIDEFPVATSHALHIRPSGNAQRRQRLAVRRVPTVLLQDAIQVGFIRLPSLVHTMQNLEVLTFSCHEHRMLYVSLSRLTESG
jgi:hypothetical protein